MLSIGRHRLYSGVTRQCFRTSGSCSPPSRARLCFAFPVALRRCLPSPSKLPSSFRRPPSFRQHPVAFLRFIRWGLLIAHKQLGSSASAHRPRAHPQTLQRFGSSVGDCSLVFCSSVLPTRGDCSLPISSSVLQRRTILSTG